MRLTLLFLLLSVSHTVSAQEGPLNAVEDFFNINSDSTLTVEAPGLLSNDDLIADTLQVLAISSPANGELSVGVDGSFIYIPDPGFSGIDEFTYQIETIPLHVLDVDTLLSLMNFTMDVSVPIVGSDDAEAEGRIGGKAALYASNTIGELVEMNLQVIDPLELGFRFGGIVTVGRLFANADANAFNLVLVEPGAPSEIIDGLFTQQAAKINVDGTVLLEGTGVLSGQVPEDPQEFDTETEADVDIQLSFTDSTLTAEVPVELTESFDLSGVDVDMVVTGSLVASGPLQPVLSSNVASVRITVDPLSRTGIEDGVPLRFALDQNYPNPFATSTTIQYSLAQTEHVVLKVYDTLGREVATLVEGMHMMGMHEVVFDAASLPSGMYVYRVEAGTFSDSKTLLLVR